MRSILILLATVSLACAHDPREHPTLAGWAEEQVITQRLADKLGICPDFAANNIQCKCCADSEILRDVQYRVSRVDAGDEWWYRKDGEWKRIPDEIIHWGESAPSGEPVLFALGSHLRCFFPPKEGG